MKKEREDRMQKVFREAVEANPIIAAVKDEEGLKSCCENEEIGVVFLLFGDICSISGLVGQAVSYTHLQPGRHIDEFQ